MVCICIGLKGRHTHFSHCALFIRYEIFKKFISGDARTTLHLVLRDIKVLLSQDDSSLNACENVYKFFTDINIIFLLLLRVIAIIYTTAMHVTNKK